MNKHDNIMIGSKSIEKIKADSIISQINEMIKNREIMDEIELSQELCDRKVCLINDHEMINDGYVFISHNIYDDWKATVNSGREEALSYKDHKKSPFYDDPEEVQKKRLNYGSFKRSIEICIQRKGKYIGFDQNPFYGWDYHIKIYNSRKHYTKDMPNLHNITKERFEQLVREGYDCWDVECFQEPQIDRSGPRYDWERFKQRLCRNIIYYDLKYFYSYSMNGHNIPKVKKQIKIPKDITQERWIALVDEGYNVFEVTHAN